MKIFLYRGSLALTFTFVFLIHLNSQSTGFLSKWGRGDSEGGFPGVTL